MKSRTVFVLALASAFGLGWLAHATPNGLVAAAATNPPSAGATMAPMPMGSGMQMGPGMSEATCHNMQKMMQQAKSPADKALMQAMMDMHHSMMGMQLTGSADHDFVVMMIPHHQSAIEMARVELQYGKDSKVRQLAQNIMSAQQQEIVEMEGWLRAGTL